MAVYSRISVIDSGTVALKAVFVDDAGNFLSPSTGPVVYIYDSTVDTDTIYNELEAAVFTSALDGPLTPTEISEGFWELSYVVPSGSPAGLWKDVWVSQVETTDSNAVLGFTVDNGVDISDQHLSNNELIVIELDESIASYLGLTLAGDVQLSFLTVLSPFYASPDLVRMEVGPWIDFIPDSTLALMIHLASKEADFIMSGSRSSASRVGFARSKFVIYDAVLRALYLPGSWTYQSGSGGSGGTLSKRLGDLSISSSEGSTVARTSSGIDTATLGHIRALRDEWWRVVNAGGEIMPGQSLGFEAGLRGIYDPDRRVGGRGWADPNEFSYSQPGVNAKAVFPGYRKGKFYFRNDPSY